MTKKLVLVAGAPGSGKTYIGKQIAKKTKSTYLDKDTISRFSTELLLTSMGSNINDRESSIYLDNIKDIEYKTLIKTAIENLEAVDIVICSAPFIGQIQNQEWLDDLVFDLEVIDAALVVIWVKVDIPTAKERILSRGANRDMWKLSNWAEYSRTTPHSDINSSYPIQIIDNSNTLQAPLEEQINQFIKDSLQ
ncbi:ATP-binding protein [Psychrobacter sp. PP-21]|uniref:AAA family ATPase n=1 Tax=Psychrobacter sp. PP-21 TaxID=2957503 RepID=UPI0029BD8FEF|nr:AAA family ATPase [Psychrobacter sp. PP-21]MDX2372787.1 ATP-binding protein [Psychrobacter sp. PP-21]